jgi:hypothetical protein
MDALMPVCSRAFRLALVVSVFSVSYWVAANSISAERKWESALAISSSFAAAAWFVTQMWELIRKASTVSGFSQCEENGNAIHRKKAS